jgi:hypothetical protein
MPHPVAAFAIYLLLTLGVVRLTAPPDLPGHRKALIVAGLLLVLLPLGQAWQNPRALYPFVDWTMYASPVPAGHMEYVAVDDRGRTFLYPFATLAVSSPWALMARFDDLVVRCACTAGDPLVDRALRALADIHEAETGVAVVRIEAYEGWTAADREGRRLAYVWTRSARGAPSRPSRP